MLIIMDRAGWHCANDLVRSDNIPAVLLPPYSPELDAIERPWLYLEERFLSHRLWPDHDAIVDAVCKSWQRVTSDTGRIKSLCSMEWEKALRNSWGRYHAGFSSLDAGREKCRLQSSPLFDGRGSRRPLFSDPGNMDDVAATAAIGRLRSARTAPAEAVAFTRDDPPTLLGERPILVEIAALASGFSHSLGSGATLRRGALTGDVRSVRLRPAPSPDRAGTFPGSRMPLGSKAASSRRISAISASGRQCPRNGASSVPRPCSGGGGEVDHADPGASGGRGLDQALDRTIGQGAHDIGKARWRCRSRCLVGFGRAGSGLVGRSPVYRETASAAVAGWHDGPAGGCCGVARRVPCGAAAMRQAATDAVPAGVGQSPSDV